jgi:hypothetical protein
MTMANLSPIDETLKQAGLPENAIIRNLGEALLHADSEHAVFYLRCPPYFEIGMELWAAAEYKLYSFLCDAAERAPKKWLNDVISGDVRELTVSILTLLVASLHVPLSIAVPITALVIKKQLAAFCRRKPRKPELTLSEIIVQRRPREKKPRKTYRTKQPTPLLRRPAPARSSRRQS